MEKFCQFLSFQPSSPQKVVFITDAGRDHDDEVTLIVARGLEKLGFVQVIGVIANLSVEVEGQFTKRASFVKGTLNELAFDRAIPVAVGSVDDPKHVPKSHEFDCDYFAHPNTLHNACGQQLLQSLCEEVIAKKETFHLCLISGMTDANQFCASHSNLAKQAIHSVSIMGGIRVSDTGEIIRDEEGHCLPLGAYNNRVGTPSETLPGVSREAIELYKFLQHAAIPTRILSREAVYQIPFSPSFFSQLATHPTTSNPVTRRLQRGFQQAMNETYWPDSAQKNNLDWFCSMYTTNTEEVKELMRALPTSPPYTPGNTPWDYIQRLHLYDPIAFLAGIFPLEHFPAVFNPEALSHSSVVVFGVSAQQHSIAQPAFLVSLLTVLITLGASRDHSTTPEEHA